MCTKTEIAAAILVIFSFALSAYFYPMMQDSVVTHWNEFGVANGWMGKEVGLFISPAITAIAAALMIIIPKLDPKRENIEKFRRYYDGFVLLVISFLIYVHTITLVYNAGYPINTIQYLSPGFAALIIYCGKLLEMAKPNWSIGIRTPWTLSSDAVWEKTHKLGAKLFHTSGWVALLGIVFPDLAIILIVVPLLVSAVVCVAYSYFEYEKERKAGKTRPKPKKRR